jgi:hypothetical protein
MTQQLIFSNADEVVDPPLHDADVQGLLLIPKGNLLISIQTTDGSNKCIVLRGVERLRADDFREGNIILDVTVSSGASIEMEDICYAYGLEKGENPFVQRTMDRLMREKRLVVTLNPSYGCMLVCICRDIEIKDDFLPRFD